MNEYVKASGYSSCVEEPMSQLRFIRRYAENASGEARILQQAWKRDVYGAYGERNGYEIVWRDVPLEENP